MQTPINNLTVCHVVPTLDPAAGGPAAVAPRLAAAQCGGGAAVRLIAVDEGPDRRQAVGRALEHVPGFAGVSVHRLARHSTVGRLFGRTAGGELDDALRGASMVHLHGLWEPIVARAASRRRRLGLPYIVQVHGMLDPWSLAQHAAKKRIALAVYYRGMLNRAACLVALNRDEAEGIAPLGLAAPVHVLPNGVFLEEMDRTVEVPTEAAPPTDRHTVLFLGRIHYKKGLDLLVEAFSRIAPEYPEANLVIAGPDDGYADELDRLIAGANLPGRIHRAGALYGDDKLAALRQADLFVLPSRQEGFSIALLEAMASRCAVVTTDCAHFPEIAEHQAGWIVPADAASVARALGEALADSDRRSARGRAGRQLVESGYTWPVVAEKSVVLYRELLSAEGPS